MKPSANRALPRAPARSEAKRAGRRWFLVSVPAPFVLAVVLLCGCSTFNRDWRAAAGKTAPPDSLEGRWEGRWVSEVSGHHGRLRCLLTRESDDRLAARFRANYGKVLHFTYTVPLSVQTHYGGWEFSGEENLGKFAGGVFYYEGRASPTNFFSTYRAKHDRGFFEMRRPE